MNWKNGTPTETGNYWVKGIAGVDPARIFSAQVRNAARGVVMFVADLDRVVRASDLRDGFHVAVRPA
jgi:hypothetical protein